MKKKIIGFFTLLVLVLPVITIGDSLNYEETIYVDDDNIEGPWDGSIDYPYANIQDAIDNASKGDLVFVYAGVYIENVFIDKQLILQGQDKHSTFIDGGGIHDCIYLTSNADGVVISGFSIQHSGNESGGGIFDQGIDIHASYTMITDNIISEHPENAIGMWCSNHNNISFNLIQDNGRAGIEANDCRYNQIFRNKFSNNSEWGVMFHLAGISEGNQVVENIFKNNFKGMSLVRQAGNDIKRNNFINNQGGHGRSDFSLFSRTSFYTNNWDANYWDDWNGKIPRRISGFFSFDVDWHPNDIPYVFNRGL